MGKLWWIPTVATCWGLIFFSMAVTSVSAEDSFARPNVILILTDDQGYGDLGANGNDQIRTPNLDRLAGAGVGFSSFYVTPVCSTTRAGLLTGRYHQRVGVPWPFWGAEVLRHREVTIAEVLKQAGYRTAIVGKWHLGRFGKYSPLTHGFDEFFGFRDGMIDDYHDPHLEHNGKSVRTAGYISDVLTDAALRFVENNRGTPFFLYLAYNAPHLPHQPPWRYEEKYVKQGLPSGLAKIYGMVSSIDEGVGRILARLEELGLDENTIVLFLSDNGPQLGRSRQRRQLERLRSPDWYEIDGMWRGVNRYNAGLRGEKRTVYEGGIRSPLLVLWPGHLPEGQTVDAMAAYIDLMPTIIDLCGVTPAESLDLDGKSLALLMKGEERKTPHDKLFFWVDEPVMPGGYGVLNDNARFEYPRKTYAARSGQWKLVSGKELYNLDSDPFEQKNLAAVYPDKMEEMEQAFERWAVEVTRLEDLVL